MALPPPAGDGHCYVRGWAPVRHALSNLRYSGGITGAAAGRRTAAHPGATCSARPATATAGSRAARRAGPKDRAAPLTRTASGVGSAGWPRQRPVRGRVQGPGCGAEGEAVPTPVSCPGEAGQRTASVDRVFVFAWVAGA